MPNLGRLLVSKGCRMVVGGGLRLSKGDGGFLAYSEWK